MMKLSRQPKTEVAKQIGCLEFKVGGRIQTEGIGTITKKGYVQLTLPGDTSTKYFAHQIAYAYYYGIEALPNSRQYHVSHLCHNKLCIRKSHIVVEIDWYNRSRNYCVFRLADNTLACNHRPACIAPHPDKTMEAYQPLPPPKSRFDEENV